jgi:hypothetical protein
MTFVLVSVVLETAISKKSLARAQAPLAIGGCPLLSLAA